MDPCFNCSEGRATPLVLFGPLVASTALRQPLKTLPSPLSFSLFLCFLRFLFWMPEPSWSAASMARNTLNLVVWDGSSFLAYGVVLQFFYCANWFLSVICTSRYKFYFYLAVSIAPRTDSLVWVGQCATLLGWNASDGGSPWTPSSLSVWWTNKTHSRMWWSKNSFKFMYGIHTTSSWFYRFNLSNWKHITSSFIIWCFGSLWQKKC